MRSDAAAISAVAGLLGVALANVRLTKGETSRAKTFLVSDVALEQVIARLGAG